MAEEEEKGGGEGEVVNVEGGKGKEGKKSASFFRRKKAGKVGEGRVAFD